MSSQRRTLAQAEGVSLEEACLLDDGGITARAYVVTWLRTPETWDFQGEREARSKFDDEVAICRDDPFVQHRLTRR